MKKSRERQAAWALILAVLVVFLAGCGAVESSSEVFSDVAVIWDAPLQPPPHEGEADWATGKVTDVSTDGSTVEFEITRGVFNLGSRVGVYVAIPEEPGPHYMWDEAREMRVVDATVVAVTGKTCRASVIPGTTEAAVSKGDDVIARVP